MAVPDTNTFSQQDVETELGGITDLQACFTASVDSAFDATYKGSKNSLYNFRNYGAIPVRAVYGYLYNWWVANNTNIAPTGWHIPTQAEVNALAVFIDPSATAINNVAGKELKESGLTYWDSPNTGTNSVGFKGRGTGYREDDGAFIGFKEFSSFWSLPEKTSTHGTFGGLRSFLDQMTYFFGAQGYSTPKKVGHTLRFIKDNSTNPGTITDYDGNPYDCVTIGTQVWTVQNFKCTHYNNGTAIPKVTDATAWAALTTAAYCAYDNDENNV